MTVDLRGKVIVFTGGLSRMTRAEASVKAIMAGVRLVGNSVCARTQYLIMAAEVGNSRSNKIKDALKVGVQIISENDFYDFLDEYTTEDNDKKVNQFIPSVIKRQYAPKPVNKIIPKKESNTINNVMEKLLAAPELDLD